MLTPAAAAVDPPAADAAAATMARPVACAVAVPADEAAALATAWPKATTVDDPAAEPAPLTTDPAPVKPLAVLVPDAAATAWAVAAPAAAAAATPALVACAAPVEPPTPVAAPTPAEDATLAPVAAPVAAAVAMPADEAAPLLIEPAVLPVAAAVEGVPFITVKNLTAGPGISFVDTKFITEEDHEDFTRRTHPERNDILISKDGTIGVVRKIDTDRVFSIFVSVALVKPIDPRLSDYLTLALQAPCVQEQIVPKGAALKHLYLHDLRRLPIPIGPISELDRTVALMQGIQNDLESLETAYSQKLQSLDALRQTLLQKAFAGELT